MNSRPTLCRAPMVRGLLAKTKTQTRRPIKPQPRNPVLTKDPGVWADCNPPVTRYFACPYGVPGAPLRGRRVSARHHSHS